MLDAELDAAVWCWLNSVTLLLALKTGQLLVVQLKLDRDTVHDISVNLVATNRGFIADCITDHQVWRRPHRFVSERHRW